MWNIKKIVSKGDYNYALVPEHPNATKNGYVLEHRIVMENYLGRLLDKNEVVHHKDGNKKNNNIDNLEIMSQKEHASLHGKNYGHQMVLLKCPWPECQKIFPIRKNKSFLIKKNKYQCTCCSNSCRGKLTREIQLHGITDELKNTISENLLAEYIEYTDEDNSEVTDLQQEP